MESPAQGNYSYKLLYKARFNCYFLPVFGKVAAVLLCLVVLPGLGAALWLFYTGRIGEDELALILLGCNVGVASPIFIAFVLRAHYKAKNAPLLPRGYTTLRWSPYTLEVIVENEQYVYFWKDVTRLRCLGDSVILSFPGGKRTGLLADKSPAAVRKSIREAMRQAKNLRAANGKQNTGPIIS